MKTLCRGVEAEVKYYKEAEVDIAILDRIYEDEDVPSASKFGLWQGQTVSAKALWP